MKKEKNISFMKNLFLFSINGFIPKAIAFILVPIYTKYLETAEFGIVELINTTVSLLVPFFTLNIHDAVLRYSFDNKYKKSDVLSVAMKIIMVGIIIVFGGTITIGFAVGFGISNKYIFFFLLNYFILAINNTASIFCRTIDKVNIIVISGTINSVVTLILNIVFLIILKLGINGYLLANSIGAMTSLVFMFVSGGLFGFIERGFNVKLSKKMLCFSIPMIFSAVSWWINNASDRYILSWLSGVAVSGVYSVAYKIPGILSVFQSIFSQAWSISAIKEFDREDSDGFISGMYNAVNFTMVAMCSFIMLLNIPIAKVLYLNEFFSAWKYVPPLLVSVVFNAVSLFAVSIFVAAEDTKAISLANISGALTNIVLNFILIRAFGAYGAAIATLAGFFVTFLIMHLNLKKHVHVHVNWKRDVLLYTILIVQMIISFHGIKTLIFQLLSFVLILFVCRKQLFSFYESFKSTIKAKKGEHCEL